MKIGFGNVMRCGLIAASLMTLATTARAQTGQFEVQIDVQTLHCLDEEDDLTNDEPYLIIVPFFIDGTTVRFGRVEGGGSVALPGSRATVLRVSSTQDNIRNGNDWCQEGQTYSIPISTGRFIHRIAPISPELFGIEGAQRATMGLIVVLMEEDSSPRAAADAARDAMVSALQRELDLAIFRQHTNTASIVAEVRQAAERAAVAATLGPFNLGGVLGPDDVVGVQFMAFSVIELVAARARDLPINMHFGPENGEYRVTGRITSRDILPPLPPQLTVTVHRVVAVGGFGETADFYAKINVGGIQRQSAVIDDRDEISPGWSWAITPPPGDVVPVDIEIWDRDGGFSGGDDPVDISPAAGLPLRLTVNRRTGEIFEGGQRLGSFGQRINTRGRGTSERAVIEFSINSPPPPPPQPPPPPPPPPPPSPARQQCLRRCDDAWQSCLERRGRERPSPAQCASGRTQCRARCPAQ